MVVRWSERAVKSYERTILLILENWNIEIALRFEHSTNVLIQNLEKYAHFCPPSIKVKKLRKCVISEQTSLIYEVHPDIIRIIAFIDNRSGIEY